MEFEFTTAGRVLFGRGTLSRVGTLVSQFGTRPLIVTGRDPQRHAGLFSALREAGIDGPDLPIPGEPDLDTVRKGRELGRQQKCDLVIGFGGGSAIDAAKAIAALISNPGDVLDYLEVVGAGKPLPKPGLPFIAIPTTAGTGAEVTRNAVLGSLEHRVKASLRSPGMLAKVALIDPALTDGLPPGVTASTGLDALTQLIEAFVCSRANPFTDALCREGLKRAARALPAVCGPEPSQSGRDDMALAALFSGIALANAGLGAVHGFAGPIGGMFPAPHGAVCAALLAPVMETNFRVLQSRAPESPSVERFHEVGRHLCGSAGAAAQDGIRWVRELVHQLQIPPLATYGIKEADIPELVAKAAKASSMKANPVSLTAEELAPILEQAV